MVRKIPKDHKGLYLAQRGIGRKPLPLVQKEKMKKENKAMEQHLRAKAMVERLLRKDAPVFENVAICMACGKEKHVNASGFCEECWVQFSHLRRPGR